MASELERTPPTISATMNTRQRQEANISFRLALEIFLIKKFWSRDISLGKDIELQDFNLC